MCRSFGRHDIEEMGIAAQMVAYPDDLKYSSQHEWVREPGNEEGSVRVGITDFAQDSLGDVVYVTLPELGAEVAADDPCGELESTKSVSDIFAPVSGTVVAINDQLEGSPELLNSDPYGDGWILEIRPSEQGQLAQLLDAEGYRAVAENGA